MEVTNRYVKHGQNILPIYIDEKTKEQFVLFDDVQMSLSNEAISKDITILTPIRQLEIGMTYRNILDNTNSFVMDVSIDHSNPNRVPIVYYCDEPITKINNMPIDLFKHIFQEIRESMDGCVLCGQCDALPNCQYCYDCKIEHGI